VEEGEQRLGQPALGLDALGESGDAGREAARPREMVRIRLIHRRHLAAKAAT
jgi:hypothetical protein